MSCLVKINLGILGWQYLEPQANGWFTLASDYFITSGYKEEYIFNDILFYKTDNQPIEFTDSSGSINNV